MAPCGGSSKGPYSKSQGLIVWTLTVGSNSSRQVLYVL